jgi:hypothetical protein
MKQLPGTHHVTNDHGHTFYGTLVGPALHNMDWFLPLCDDGKTPMKEPICIVGVRPNHVEENTD